MAVPGENIRSWSTTALSNGSADSLIAWPEGQTRASVNNSARSMMAAHAKWRDLINGSIVTTGSANAQAFSSGLGYTVTPETGLIVKLKIGATFTNTATMTLNMDSLGAITVLGNDGNALVGGEVVAGSYTDWLWNGTNWILLGTALTAATSADQITGTSTSDFVTPGRQQYHKSACKAWGILGTAGNIADSYNISSVTDAAVGQVIVNWDTDFASSNYCCIGQGLIAPGGGQASTYITHIQAQTAASITMTLVNLGNYSASDPTQWNVVAYGALV